MEQIKSHEVYLINIKINMDNQIEKIVKLDFILLILYQ